MYVLRGYTEGCDTRLWWLIVAVWLIVALITTRINPEAICEDV